MIRIRHFVVLGALAAFLAIGGLMMASLANAAGDDAETGLESTIGVYDVAHDDSAAAHEFLQVAQQTPQAQCHSRCNQQRGSCLGRCTGPMVDSQGRGNPCHGQCNSQYSTCASNCPQRQQPQRSSPGTGVQR